MTRYWRACINYIFSLFYGILSTLALELGFNRMRDNEARGARRKVRGDDQLQALSIANIGQTFRDKSEKGFYEYQTGSVEGASPECPGGRAENFSPDFRLAPDLGIQDPPI